MPRQLPSTAWSRGPGFAWPSLRGSRHWAPTRALSVPRPPRRQPTGDQIGYVDFSDKMTASKARNLYQGWGGWGGRGLNVEFGPPAAAPAGTVPGQKRGRDGEGEEGCILRRVRYLSLGREQPAGAVERQLGHSGAVQWGWRASSAKRADKDEAQAAAAGQRRRSAERQCPSGSAPAGLRPQAANQALQHGTWQHAQPPAPHCEMLQLRDPTPAPHPGGAAREGCAMTLQLLVGEAGWAAVKFGCACTPRSSSRLPLHSTPRPSHAQPRPPYSMRRPGCGCGTRLAKKHAQPRRLVVPSAPAPHSWLAPSTPPLIMPPLLQH